VLTSRGAFWGIVLLLAAVVAILIAMRDLDAAPWSIPLATIEESEAVLSEQVRELAGRDATECGAIGLVEGVNESASCASRAHSEGRAFWVASQVQSDDSDIWVVVIGGAGGGLSSVHFDSNPMGQGGLRKGQRYSTYGEALCDRLTIDASARKAVGCV
jgi:hypothetical protein